MFNKIVTSSTEQYVFGFSFHSFCIGCTGLCPCTDWFKRLLDEQQLTALLHPIFNEKSIYQYTVKCTIFGPLFISL